MGEGVVRIDVLGHVLSSSPDLPSGNPAPDQFGYHPEADQVEEGDDPVMLHRVERIGAPGPTCDRIGVSPDYPGRLGYVVDTLSKERLGFVSFRMRSHCGLRRARGHVERNYTPPLTNFHRTSSGRFVDRLAKQVRSSRVWWTRREQPVSVRVTELIGTTYKRDREVPRLLVRRRRSSRRTRMPACLLA